MRSRFLQYLSAAPGEVASSYKQSPVARQGNHPVQDAASFAVGLWDELKEVGGIEFRVVDRHPAALGHHDT